MAMAQGHETQVYARVPAAPGANRAGLRSCRTGCTVPLEMGVTAMTASNLLIEKFKDATVVTIQDPRLLESRTLDALGEDLYRLVDQMNRKMLVVDCSKVQFLSSAAFSVFINLHKKSAAIKGTLILCGLKKDLMQVFEITRLTKLFKFAPDEKAAVEMLGYSAAG